MRKLALVLAAAAIMLIAAPTVTVKPAYAAPALNQDEAATDLSSRHRRHYYYGPRCRKVVVYRPGRNIVYRRCYRPYVHYRYYRPHRHWSHHYYRPYRYYRYY